MPKRGMVAALASCAALLILSLPMGSPVPAKAAQPPNPLAPPQPAIGHGDPSLPHSPQMLQMLARGGRGAGMGAANAQGIDIASYQHPNGAGINWGQVAGGGYKFAYIKATEGDYYQNPYYPGDAAGAGGAGMFRGAYHFAIPNGADGATQADYLLNSAGYANDGLTLPPMLDIEWDPYGTDACYGLNASQMIGWIAAFSNEVQRRIGRLPVIYTAASWWTQCTGGTSAFSANPLDIASWGSGNPQTPGWSTWAFWQTTSGAAVPGIGTAVDADVFNGDVSQLAAFVGGLSGSRPAAVSWAQNRLDIVAVGRDKALWHMAWDGTQWVGWQALGGQINGDPAMVSWGPNRLDIFARGADNSMWHQAWDGAQWSGWQPLGGSLTTDPEAASWSAGRLDVMARGLDGQMWILSWDGTRWWPWRPLGGVLNSKPAVTAWSPGRLDVIAQGSDRGLWHLAWDGTQWVGWQKLGGQAIGDPAMVSWSPGRLDAFVRGTDQAMYHMAWDGAQWVGWQPLGGGFVSDPSVVAWGPNRLDVFADGLDRSMFHAAWDGSNWVGWQAMGGGFTAAPRAASWGVNRLDVTGRGGGDGIWWNGWDGSRWLPGWQSLGGVPGAPT